MKTRRALFSFLFVLLTGSACNKAILHSKDREMEPVSRTFATSVPDALRVAKEVLLNLGYKIDNEDPAAATLKTGWRSTRASSHYLDLFDRQDYGTVGAYYRIDLRVKESSGKADVEVSAPVRSVIGRIRSSHREEKKILGKIADQLRREDFEMTNVGVQE